MALISCPECSREISDNAIRCPNCGFSPPQTQIRKGGTAVECPSFPDDLSLSSVVRDWNGPVVMSGQTSITCLIEPFTGGELGVVLHQNGLLVTNKGGTQSLRLHCSQLIEVDVKTEQEVTLREKSVIGRAAVGAILLGPVGAVVGGMSALNKTCVKQRYFLTIHYWDIQTRKDSILSIESEAESLCIFLNKYKKVQKRYKEMPDNSKSGLTAHNLVIGPGNVLECPSCAVKLRLDENEIRTQSFICPECNENIVFRND